MSDVHAPQGVVNRDVVAAALEAVGCRDVHIRNDKVLSTCPMEVNHDGGRDDHPSHAVVIRDNPKSAICVCLSCGYSEPLEMLLLRTWFEKQIPVSKYLPNVMWSDEPEDQDDSLSARLLRLEGADIFESKPARRHRVEWHEMMGLDEIPYVVIPESIYAPYAGRVPHYAMERGFTLDSCREWSLGHDPVKRRLMFPSRNHEGKLVGFSGRSYSKYDDCPRCHGILAKGKCTNCTWAAPPKYLNSQGDWRHYVLYGEWRLDFSKRYCLVVESQTNAVAGSQVGAANVIATYGEKISSIQFAKLRTWFDEVWTWGDPDAAGSAMDQRILDTLGPVGTTVNFVTKPAERDVAKLLEDGYSDLILQTLRSARYPL